MIGLVLAAAGQGYRFGGDVPKQFSRFRGQPLYQHALEAFLPFCSQAVVVVPQSWIDRVGRQVEAVPKWRDLLLQAGGASRQDSVELGLKRLGTKVDHVLVHDAARPHASPELIERVIRGMRRWGACIPVLPIADTVKEIAQGEVAATLDRSRLGLAQTPQGFERELLERAFRTCREEGFQGTDESSLVERTGAAVHVVEGDPRNLKITWQRDL